MAVRIAELADVPALVPVLARAFAEDPLICWLVREGPKRDAGFARFFELALRHLSIPFGEVYTNDARSGAALWVPPGKWHMGLGKELVLVRHFAAICGWSRLLHCQRATVPMAKAHPKAPHHYLMVVGVDPAVQGKGVGRELLAPMLATCDRDRVLAHLETATERNLGYYQNLGFAITGEHAIANGPRIWFMTRAPHA